MPRLAVGDMGYRAGVQDIDIGFIRGFHEPVPGGRQLSCQLLHFRLVQLTAEAVQGNGGSCFSLIHTDYCFY
jgi:hypothetical protein